jgi:hypothetical protein
MHWTYHLKLGLVISAFWPMTISAKDISLAASSKWAIDYADDSCRLMRTFGTDPSPLLLQFIRYGPGPFFDLHVIGEPLGSLRPETPARLNFGPGGTFVRSTPAIGTAGTIPAIFLAGRLDNIDMNSIDRSDFAKMSVEQRLALSKIEPSKETSVSTATLVLGAQTFTLGLGSMGPPMEAMRKCTNDLVESWGLDPAEQEALICLPQPKSSPGSWLRSGDYPKLSADRGEQAIIRYRLMVDGAGIVVSCAVQAAFAKNADFAETTCNILKRRARFEPARTATGAPVASYYLGKVRWRIG